MTRVTVLMPVYNGEKYIRKAIDSIVNQTFCDFEMLIINDGSTDDSAGIVESYKDRRIRFVHNEENLGLIASLNKGLDLARGEYIARMDCDDMSLPHRLSRQVAFMDAYPEAGACGAWVIRFGSGRLFGVRFPTDAPNITSGLIFDATLPHPAVMLRRSILDSHGLRYDPAYKSAEDYELWVRLSDYCSLANIGEFLLAYREHDHQISTLLSAEQSQSAGMIRRRLMHKLQIEPTREEYDLHQKISMYFAGDISWETGLLSAADLWLCRLRDANAQTEYFPESPFTRTLVLRWFMLCGKAMSQGHGTAKDFLRARIIRGSGLPATAIYGILLSGLYGKIFDRTFQSRLRRLLDSATYS